MNAFNGVFSPKERQHEPLIQFKDEGKTFSKNRANK